MTDYRTLADVVATDIASGKLTPGTRLPPQREFAYRHGIAVSTATRVYAELVHRGLVAGEVGRGTYVRAPAIPVGTALAEARGSAVDLELNFPILPQQAAEMIDGLTTLIRAGMLDDALRPISAAATPAARQTAATFLSRGHWRPDSEAMLFTANGRQAIAACLSALAGAGDRIGVEALTYPAVVGIASQLGLSVVPLPLDDEGVRPDALREAHRAGPLKLVYLQPTLHNPLGCTMSRARRTEIAGVLEETGLTVIEDAVYSFLADEEPLAAFAPDHAILVDSLSKRLSPGLTLGFVVPPLRLRDTVARGIRSGAWSAAAFPLSAALQLVADGSLDRISRAKRADAAARQQVAHAALAGLDVRADRRAYHLWLKLPEGWRSESFAAAAAREGIAITPASAFAATSGYAPSAVRIALGPPTRDELSRALETLRRLAQGELGEPRVE
jgi:DNA-binding transcriptional MocR family regulator